MEHLRGCEAGGPARTHLFQLPLEIAIRDTQIVEDHVDHRTYTEYVIRVAFNGRAWIVQQKYRTFCQLHERLINMFPSVRFPASSQQFCMNT